LKGGEDMDIEDLEKGYIENAIIVYIDAGKKKR
jgi:hypothetical protein